MSLSLPPDTLSFVDQMVASGRYASRDEVVVAAIDLMKRKREQMRALQDSLDEAAEQLENGDVSTLSLEELLAEGRRLFAQRNQST